MANIVITSNDNRVLIAFNDLSDVAGLTTGDFAKVDVSTELNISNIDLFFIVTGLHQWRFSYNGSIGSLQVDSVNGQAPISNTDLNNKLQSILAVQTIPSQTGNTGKYLKTDGTNLSWDTPSGGGGALSITSIEQNLGSSPTWRGKFTVIDAAINTGTKIQIWQRFAALTGKGTRADENELDAIMVNAEPGEGQMTVYWQTQPQYITSKLVKEGNTVRNSTSVSTPYQDVFIYETKRIGKVTGNFKFNYIIS